MSQVPSTEKDDVRRLEVEVQGNTFYSKESRKVLIKLFKPASFIQTDKPIYIPGQTGEVYPGTQLLLRCCGNTCAPCPSPLQGHLSGLGAEAVCSAGESAASSKSSAFYWDCTNYEVTTQHT